jgi:hypothetical protein
MVLHRPDVRAAFNDPRKPGTADSRLPGEWLKMLAIIAAIVFLVVALPTTVTYLSLTVLNRMKDSPASPALVVAVEQKLRGEILQRLAENGWKPETLSVSVSPDLRRAECHLGRLWKNGFTQEPPWLAAVRITRTRPGLWLVQGEGEFHTLRFSVDTTPETTFDPRRIFKPHTQSEGLRE